MQISESTKQHITVEYYPLPSGKVDVFLHKNETTRTDEEGNMIYVAEEVSFQTVVSENEIKNNFEYYWNNGEKVVEKVTLEERVTTTETKVVTIEETIDVLFGGIE